MGLFYTAPGNLNNVVENFALARDPDKQLNYETGRYLDPNMQFRSEVYGFRLYVDFAGGGFSGQLALHHIPREVAFAGRVRLAG
jgi:hypothetical protein